ncbi:hypothetical protein [Kribbella kalugense]|uniref:hypothetical protein n=1 Tax=Kribbella kalugense TaxID=2512221 RepID=UPI00141708B7|nr:hypothetical protein [Kribbella kalugense]
MDPDRPGAAGADHLAARAVALGTTYASTTRGTPYPAAVPAQADSRYAWAGPGR